MEQKIELSVIVPAYNTERYLGRCLDSILKQSVKAMELIVVDAGSTDDTRKIIEKYAQKHTEIVPIYSNENLWASAARNKALDIAQGEYIAFCDADDTVPKGAYKEMLRVARSGNVDIVTGNYGRKFRDEIREIAAFKSPTAVERCFENSNTTLWNKIIKRDFIGDIRLPEDMRTVEDFPFLAELYRKSPSISCTDYCVYYYTLQRENEEDDKIHDDFYDPHPFFKDFMASLRRIYEKPFENWESLWARLYTDFNIYVFQFVWSQITDPDSRKAAFDEMRENMKYLQKKNIVCDFGKNQMADLFASAFSVDYVAFQALSYEQYILALLISRKNVTNPSSFNTSDSFVELCRQGGVGLRTILRCMRGWFHFKLHRKRSN